MRTPIVCAWWRSPPGDNADALAAQVQRYRPARGGHRRRAAAQALAARGYHGHAPASGREGLWRSPLILTWTSCCVRRRAPRPRSRARGHRRWQDHRAGEQGSAGHGRRVVIEAARAHVASRCCRWTASTTRFISACTAAAPEVRRLVLTASGGPFRAWPPTPATRDLRTRCGIRRGRWGGRSRSTRRR